MYLGASQMFEYSCVSNCETCPGIGVNSYKPSQILHQAFFVYKNHGPILVVLNLYTLSMNVHEVDIVPTATFYGFAE